MARISEAIDPTSRLPLYGPTWVCLAALLTMTACKPPIRGGGGSGGSAADGGGGSAADGGGGSAADGG
ncbi:MAG TPA: hypothetical protein VL242_19725, partial [Sorangium sp.]|nr:hypothetical protein [Sorangium sp.]